MKTIFFKDGLFARQFPVKQEPVRKIGSLNIPLEGDVVDISDNFTGKSI